MHSDEELYRRYLSGNEESLRALLERYAEGLTLFLNGFTNNIEDAKELMMDAFVVVASKKNSFEGKSSFKTWLFSIGRNLAMSRLRKRKLHLIPLEDAVDTESPYEGPETGILADEAKKAVYGALNKIKEDYRDALCLVYIEGMSYDEAARVLKKTRKQIDNLVTRGKEAMRAALEKSGFDHMV